MARRESPDGSSQLHSSLKRLEPTPASGRAALELLRPRERADTQGHVQETLFQTFKKIEKFEPRGEEALQAYMRQAIFNRIREPLDEPTANAAHMAAERAIIRLAKEIGKTRS